MCLETTVTKVRDASSPSRKPVDITVFNLAADVADAEFQRAVAAINRQVQQDFEPEWGYTGSVRGRTFASLLEATETAAHVDWHFDAIVYLGDRVDDPDRGLDNIYGYHTTNLFGVPYGFVYLDVAERLRQPWSVTLSHEILEMVANPDTFDVAERVVVEPSDGDNEASTVVRKYALEVCDPVQADSYVVLGERVANFVTPRYFALDGAASARTNVMGLPLEPFALRPGGYLQYFTGLTTHTDYADRAAVEFVDARRLLGRARRLERWASAVIDSATSGLPDKIAAGNARTVESHHRRMCAIL